MVGSTSTIYLGSGYLILIVCGLDQQIGQLYELMQAIKNPGEGKE